MHSSRFFLLGFLVSAVGWACTAAQPAPTSTGDAITAKGDDSSKTDSPKAPSGPPVSATAAPSANPSAGSDAGSPTSGTSGTPDFGDPCYNACAQQHPAGAKMVDDLGQKNFACTCAANACGPQCGSSFACSDDMNAPDPSDACMQCFETNPTVTSCDQQSQTACTADPDCAATSKCFDTCDQQSGSGFGQ